MLRQTFTSQPFTYRLAADMPAGGGLFTGYNPYLVTPPRIYGEEFDTSGTAAMFVNDEITVNGYECVYLFIQHNQIVWPSYLYRLHRWDGTTGEYLGGVDSSVTVTQHLFSQCRNGTLYSLDLVNNVYQYTIDTTTHDLVTDGVVQFSLPASTYTGFTSPTAYLIDVDLGLLLGNGDLLNHLTVWDLNTGEIKAKIPTPGYPVVVMAEDASRCYVRTSAGILVLIDYSTNEVLSAFHVQATSQALGRSICWDRKYRRFLNWVYTPITTEGQNTSVITGYYPTPQATYLTTPIPIKAPRKYRKTPILTRVCGDMGEPIGGTRVDLSFPDGTTAATLAGFPGSTDGNGEAIGYINDVDAGTITLNASATV